METICAAQGFIPPDDMEKGITRSVGWLTKYLDRAISTRKTDMYLKKPGSTMAEEPKVIWVKMLSKPVQQASKLEYFRNKFNFILEDKLSSLKHSHIMDISRIIKEDSYNKDGYL